MPGLQTQQLFSARGLEPSKIQHLAADDGGLGSKNRNLYLGNIRKPVFGKKNVLCFFNEKVLVRTCNLRYNWLRDVKNLLTPTLNMTSGWSSNSNRQEYDKMHLCQSITKEATAYSNLKFSAFLCVSFHSSPREYVTATHKPFDPKIYSMLLLLAWQSVGTGPQFSNLLWIWLLVF